MKHNDHNVLKCRNSAHIMWQLAHSQPYTHYPIEVQYDYFNIVNDRKWGTPYQHIEQLLGPEMLATYRAEKYVKFFVKRHHMRHVLREEYKQKMLIPSIQEVLKRDFMLQRFHECCMEEVWPYLQVIMGDCVYHVFVVFI